MPKRANSIPVLEARSESDKALNGLLRLIFRVRADARSAPKLFPLSVLSCCKFSARTGRRIETTSMACDRKLQPSLRRRSRGTVILSQQCLYFLPDPQGRAR